MTEMLSDNTELTRRWLVGVWAPVSGSPAETVEYRADGTVRIKMFGGLLHMDGSYRFLANGIIEICWGVARDKEAEQVVDALNEHLSKLPEAPQVNIVQRSILAITATETELHTFHLEKERVGYFRRVA